MVATKGAIMSLLLDAYQKRDQVGMVSFVATRLQWCYPRPAASNAPSSAWLICARAGVHTLAAGLITAHDVLMRYRQRAADAATASRAHRRQSQYRHWPG